MKMSAPTDPDEQIQLAFVGIIEHRSLKKERKKIQGSEALRRPVLPLRLLPLVRHLQQLRHLRRRLIVRREDVIHVLFKAVVIELPPLLDFAGHLLVDILNV